MPPSPEVSTSNHQPLSEDDLQLLRRHRRGSPLQAIFGTYLLLVFFGTGIFLLILSFDSDSYSKAGLLMPLSAIAFLGFSGFVGLRLSHMPRSWLLLNRAMAGRIPKQIVTGRLQSIQPGTKPGIHYALDTKQIDVALPYWNEIVTDSDLGVAAKTAHAMTGGLVTLHLLPLLPGRQPLLLRADYHDRPPVQSTTEPVTEKDRAPMQKATSFVQMLMLSLAGLFVIAGLILPPLFFVAVILAVISFIPAPNSRAIEQATHKRTLSGIVDEVLTFAVLEGSVNTQHVSVGAATQCSYRIGGVLYQAPGEDIRAEPGQRVTVEFLDNGDLGLVLLSFRVEDSPHSEL